jgi:hypothetical protein
MLDHAADPAVRAGSAAAPPDPLLPMSRMQVAVAAAIDLTAATLTRVVARVGA